MHPLVWVRSLTGAKAPGSTGQKPLFLLVKPRPLMGIYVFYGILVSLTKLILKLQQDMAVKIIIQIKVDFHHTINKKKSCVL
jgi:hypothetical protein